MALKIPPPPDMSTVDQVFNRWLIELTSILDNSGDINPDQISGLAAAVASINATITAMNLSLQTQINTLNAAAASLQAQVSARSSVLNGIIAPIATDGIVGDWWADTVAKHIYVKTTGTVWTLIV